MYTLPNLKYDYSALEPYIDEETMRIHHGKHHAAYVNNLNEALAGLEDLLDKDIGEVIKNLDSVPENIRAKVRNNGGGHFNHSIFWEIMCPAKVSGKPSGKFEEAINSVFGNISTFQEKFTSHAMGRFGSGWAWLIVTDGKLSITDTPNQDSPISDSLPAGRQGKPILLIDVWEHAYYLKYKNMRADYIKAWWNVVNWNKVGELFIENVDSKLSLRKEVNKI